MTRIEWTQAGPQLVDFDGTLYEPVSVPLEEAPLPPVGHVFRDAGGRAFRVTAIRLAVDGELVYPRRLHLPRRVLKMAFPGSGISAREHAIVEPQDDIDQKLGAELDELRAEIRKVSQ